MCGRGIYRRTKDFTKDFYLIQLDLLLPSGSNASRHGEGASAQLHGEIRVLLQRPSLRGEGPSQAYSQRNGPSDSWRISEPLWQFPPQIFMITRNCIYYYIRLLEWHSLLFTITRIVYQDL